MDNSHKDKNDNVETMTQNETHDFSGVTIEEENNSAKETNTTNNTSERNPYTHYQNAYRRGANSTRVRYVKIGSSSNSNWLMKAVVGVGALAVLGFFFFVALPVLLTLVGAGIVAWLIFRFFKR